MKGRIEDWRNKIVCRMNTDRRYKWRVFDIVDAGGVGRSKLVHLQPVCDSWKPMLILPSTKVRDEFFEEGEDDKA